MSARSEGDLPVLPGLSIPAGELLVEAVRSTAAASAGAGAAVLVDLVAARPLSAAMTALVLLLGLLVSLTGSYVSVRQST